MKKLTLVFLFLTSFILLKAQEVQFSKEIQYFKKLDSIQFPSKHAVLFIGSSTFTKWKDVQEYFPTHTIINRGFGGSSLPNVIYFANDIIFPYEPKQIVIYCGENDFTGPGTTTEMVVDRVKQLIELIRSKYPKVQISYISIKPSLSREKYRPMIVEANKQIEEMIFKMKRTDFINIYNAMLNPDGTVMTDIFLSDNLHMNAKGYAIWQKILEPYLR